MYNIKKIKFSVDTGFSLIWFSFKLHSLSTLLHYSLSTRFLYYYCWYFFYFSVDSVLCRQIVSIYIYLSSSSSYYLSSSFLSILSQKHSQSKQITEFFFINQILIWLLFHRTIYQISNFCKSFCLFDLVKCVFSRVFDWVLSREFFFVLVDKERKCTVWSYFSLVNFS